MDFAWYMARSASRTSSSALTERPRPRAKASPMLAERWNSVPSTTNGTRRQPRMRSATSNARVPSTICSRTTMNSSPPSRVDQVPCPDAFAGDAEPPG